MEKRADELKNVIKIFLALKKANGWVWIRELARRVNLHHKTVSRLLKKYFKGFIKEEKLPPFRICLIRLNEDMTIENFIKFWKIKKLQEIYEKKFR